MKVYCKVQIIFSLSTTLFFYSLKLGAPRPFQLAPATYCQRLQRTRLWLPICPSGKCPSSKCPSRKCPVGKLANGCLLEKKMMQFQRENSNDAAGVHLGRGPSIRSSPDGQDEAIDTPTPFLPGLQGHISHDTSAM